MKIVLKNATPAHAAKLHALISANLQEGRLLPRSLSELTTHAERFVIALNGRRLVGCAELAPLSSNVAEVRSLVVDPSARGLGVGTLLINELSRLGRLDGFDRLCAFTHCPGYFIQFGFSIVPHLWINEKVVTDCVKCPSFRHCGQYAMVVSLHEGEDESSQTTESPYAAAASVAFVRHA